MHGIVVPTGTVNAVAWAHPIEPTLSVNRNGLTPLLSYPRAHTGGSLQSSQFVDCIAGKEGAWFATCGQIADAWEPDDDDRRKFDLPDVRGVETLPSPGVWQGNDWIPSSPASRQPSVSRKVDPSALPGW
jgi:hypothetical protein